MEIHVLNAQGHSIRAIAEQLGVSRNTVRKYLRDQAAEPIYPQRTPRPTKLDPFKVYLNERVHGTTGQKPQILLDEERHSFGALPSLQVLPRTTHRSLHIARPMPVESLQHSLGVYDQLLQVVR